MAPPSQLVDNASACLVRTLSRSTSRAGLASRIKKPPGSLPTGSPAGTGLFGNAMRREDHRTVPVLRRNFVQFLDEDRAAGLKPFHDITIVDDLVADIDRCAILLQRQHHDLDRPVHAGAEAARAAEPDGQLMSGTSGPVRHMIGHDPQMAFWAGSCQGRDLMWNSKARHGLLPYQHPTGEGHP